MDDVYPADAPPASASDAVELGHGDVLINAAVGELSAGGLGTGSLGTGGLSVQK